MLHLHNIADLWEEAVYFASLFPETARIVSLVPCHHIYGFIWSVLLPKALQVPVVDNAEFQDGDLVVGTPMHWRYQNRTLLTVPQLSVVTSAAPCEPSLLQSLLQKGAVATWEIYGCSEAGGIGARDNPAEPYRLLPFWTRNAGKLSRQTKDIDPPDILEWEGERLFRPIGRVDGAVQVGGVNVYPRLIERKLLQHAKIDACQVRLTTPEQGGRLKAFLVARPEIETELRAWMEANLSSPERPRSLTFGSEIPVDDLGKPADWLT